MTAKKKNAKRAMARKRDKEDAGPDPLFGAVPFIPPVADQSLHDLFQQQTMEMLERSDLSEEQRQSILVAMNCPCCGGSGLSFTMKLKRKK